MPRLVGNAINPWFKRFELPPEADIEYPERFIMQMGLLSASLNTLLNAFVKTQESPPIHPEHAKTEILAFHYLCFLMRNGTTIGRICHPLPDELIRHHFPDEQSTRSFIENRAAFYLH